MKEEGRIKQHAKREGRREQQRASGHLVLKATRERAVRPGPGEVSQTGGAHWRDGPRSLDAC